MEGTSKKSAPGCMPGQKKGVCGGGTHMMNFSDPHSICPSCRRKLEICIPDKPETHCPICAVWVEADWTKFVTGKQIVTYQERKKRRSKSGDSDSSSTSVTSQKKPQPKPPLLGPAVRAQEAAGPKRVFTIPKLGASKQPQESRQKAVQDSKSKPVPPKTQAAIQSAKPLKQSQIFVHKTLSPCITSLSLKPAKESHKAPPVVRLFEAELIQMSGKRDSSSTVHDRHSVIDTKSVARDTVVLDTVARDKKSVARDTVVRDRHSVNDTKSVARDTVARDTVARDKSVHDKSVARDTQPETKSTKPNQTKQKEASKTETKPTKPKSDSSQQIKSNKESSQVKASGESKSDQQSRHEMMDEFSLKMSTQMDHKMDQFKETVLQMLAGIAKSTEKPEFRERSRSPLKPPHTSTTGRRPAAATMTRAQHERIYRSPSPEIMQIDDDETENDQRSHDDDEYRHNYDDEPQRNYDDDEARHVGFKQFDEVYDDDDKHYDDDDRNYDDNDDQYSGHGSEDVRYSDIGDYGEGRMKHKGDHIYIDEHEAEAVSPISRQMDEMFAPMPARKSKKKKVPTATLR